MRRRGGFVAHDGLEPLGGLQMVPALRRRQAESDACAQRRDAVPGGLGFGADALELALGLGDVVAEPQLQLGVGQA